MNNEQNISTDTLFEDESRKLTEQYAFVKLLAGRLGKPMPEIGNMPGGKSTPMLPETKISGGIVAIKTGEFFNKSLADAVRIYLERKDGAAPFPEIFEALKLGGFRMRPGEDEYRRLRLNLLKSTSFTFIPEDNFGLASVFGRPRRTPVPKSAKVKKRKHGKATTEEEDTAL